MERSCHWMALKQDSMSSTGSSSGRQKGEDVDMRADANRRSDGTQPAHGPTSGGP
jgi:hypothetical protein